jgi:2-polyprenyl-3-methyl-5-hydroxy-6-metoxy-1,4-benzoquinol methylase
MEINVTERNLNNEFQDEIDRKYAYDFDYILRDYMVKEFEPLFVRSDSIGQLNNALEMGCYKGEFTKKLSLYFDDIWVIEGASELVDYCKNEFKISPELIHNKQVNFLNQRFEETVLETKSDNVFLIHTLEHLDNPVEILKKINSWLSNKGRFFLAVPNANAASRQIAVNMGLISHNTAVTEGESQHGHRCTYNLDTLKRDAKQAGLNILKEGGVFFKPFANFQFDEMISKNIIDDEYLDGCYQLGMRYPDLCASIYLVCEKGEGNTNESSESKRI